MAGETQRPGQTKRVRVSDTVLLIVVLVFATYAFMISPWGKRIFHSRLHAQPVASSILHDDDCTPCDAAKKVQEQEMLKDEQGSVEDEKLDIEG